MKKEDIQEKIIVTLADLLEKSAADISPQLGLFEELGLESVEVLELAFALEQEFNLELDSKALWKISDYILANEMYKNGKFSDEAIALIKQTVGNISDENIDKIKNPHDVLKYLTVQDLINYVVKNKG
jgi:acyl carrier protein